MKPAGSSFPTPGTIVSSCSIVMAGRLPSGDGRCGVSQRVAVVSASLRHRVGLAWVAMAGLSSLIPGTIAFSRTPGLRLDWRVQVDGTCGRRLRYIIRSGVGTTECRPVLR